MSNQQQKKQDKEINTFEVMKSPTIALK